MEEFKLAFDNLYPCEEERKDNITNSLSSSGTNSIKSDESLSYKENPLESFTTSRNSRTSRKSLMGDYRSSRSITSTNLMFGHDQHSPFSSVDKGRKAMTDKDMVYVDKSRFSIYKHVDKFSTVTSNILGKKFIRSRKPYVLTNLSTGESYTMIRPNNESLTVSRLYVSSNDTLPTGSSLMPSSVPTQHHDPPSSSSSYTIKSSPFSLLLSDVSSANSTQIISQSPPSNHHQQLQRKLNNNIVPRERASAPTQFHHHTNKEAIKYKHSGVSSFDTQSPKQKKVKLSKESDKSKHIQVVDPFFRDWAWSHEWKHSIDYSLEQ